MTRKYKSRPRVPAIIRFRRKVIQVDGCRLFTGGVSNGYGRFFVEGQMVLAHKFAWEFVNKRPIPPGARVEHTCGKRNCVEPKHLVLSDVPAERLTRSLSNQDEQAPDAASLD